MDFINKLIKKDDPQQNPAPGTVVVNTGTISPQVAQQPQPLAAPPQQPINVAGQPGQVSTPIPANGPAQPEQFEKEKQFRDDFLKEIPGSLEAAAPNQAPTTPAQGQPASTQPADTSRPKNPNEPPSFLDTFKSMFAGKSKQAGQTPGAPQEPDLEIPGITTQQSTSKGIMDVKDIIAPPSIEVDFNHLQIGKKHYRTYFASGYPRFVDTNWLSPLINFDHALNISTFYYPVDSDQVLQKLKRKIGEMEATLYSEMEAGKVVDPKVKVSLTDAHNLQENIAKGEEKFFHFALYVSIQANNENELDEVGKSVEATMAAIGIIAKPTTLQMEQGLQSTLPTANDALYLTRNMDTSSLASTFPFVTSELTMNEGILFGLNRHNKSLVIFDRFQMENANTVVFARSGAGKSYLIKLEALRSIMMGHDLIIIDPEKEYQDLARALDGDYITFSQDSGAKINPFDIAEYEKGEGRDALRNKILMLHSFFNIMFAGLNNIEKGILDRALILTYKEKGITVDPATQNQEPPLMEDLFKVLQGMAEEEAHGLAKRLERFMRGSAAGVFNKPTNIQFKNRFTVFSLRDLQDELRPMAMFLMLDFIWTKVRNDVRKRILIVEEAWYMMQNLDSAKFMYSVAKRARKYFLGITTISQDVEDFLLNDFGRAVVTNSAIQILMKQSTAAIDRVQAVFGLSEGERSFLLNAVIGEGLFFAGTNHVAIQVISSNQEHLLITTNPKDIEEMKTKGIDPLTTGDVAQLSNPYDPEKKLTDIGEGKTTEDIKTTQSLKALEYEMSEKARLEKVQEDAKKILDESSHRTQAESGFSKTNGGAQAAQAPTDDAALTPPSSLKPTPAVQNIKDEDINDLMNPTAPSKTELEAKKPVGIPPAEPASTQPAPVIPPKAELINPTQITEGFNVDNPNKPQLAATEDSSASSNPPSNNI
jgi:conjugal transfer ATP-binding protein TraC